MGGEGVLQANRQGDRGCCYCVLVVFTTILEFLGDDPE